MTIPPGGAAAAAPLWSLPDSQRSPFGSYLPMFFFCLLFNGGILAISTTLILLYPLSYFPLTRDLHEFVLQFTKGSFGQLITLISQLFAPTKFIVTADESLGNDWVKRDNKGKVVGVTLPDRAVWISNHQTLTDWMYLWSFSYLTSHHESILITLKDSLKPIPFIGWACRIWGFLFLARNWATDKGPFKSQLEQVSEKLRSDKGTEKLALLIFPEGTIVTGNTRPKSKVYAEKLGVPDLKQTLLPRSTGTFFALRTLATTLPTLSLVDLTVGYPGPVSPFWPEDYYNLLAWLKGVSPPSIHVHIRTFKMSEIPLGKLDGTDGTEEEKKVFDEWLRERWGEKDLLLEGFLKEGRFVREGEKDKEEVVWPLGLRHWREYPAAFCYFFPLVLLWAIWPVLKLVVGVVFGKSAAGGGGGNVKEVKSCCKAAAEKKAGLKVEL